VVLHLGDDDLVTGTEPEARGLRLGVRGVAHRVGDEVDRLGGVLGEHHLPDGRPHEPGHGRAGRFVGVGRLLRELVGAPVDGGVVPLVVLALRVQHAGGLLRRGARVEVDQPAPAADRTRQDGEVGPDPVQLDRIEQAGGGGGGGHGSRQTFVR